MVFLQSIYATRTRLLNKGEGVVFWLHHDPVAHSIVFFKKCLHIHLKERATNK